jgi:hypothetical protein
VEPVGEPFVGCVVGVPPGSVGPGVLGAGVIVVGRAVVGVVGRGLPAVVVVAGGFAVTVNPCGV